MGQNLEMICIMNISLHLIIFCWIYVPCQGILHVLNSNFMYYLHKLIQIHLKHISWCFLVNDLDLWLVTLCGIVIMKWKTSLSLQGCYINEIQRFAEVITLFVFILLQKHWIIEWFYVIFQSWPWPFYSCYNSNYTICIFIIPWGCSNVHTNYI